MSKIKIEVEDKVTYWEPIQEFMEIMHAQGGHVSPVYYYEYLWDRLKPIMNEMDDYDKKMFAEKLTGKNYWDD